MIGKDMQNYILNALSATAALTFLGACGGGSGGGVMRVTSENLIGVNAETGANPRVITLVETTGNVHSQNGLSADFDGYTFESDRGFENGFAIENGSSVGLLAEIDLPTQTDLTLFDGAYDDGSGVIAIYYGLSGVETSQALPASGSASWTGSGFAELISSTGTTELGVGSATVNATFPGTMSATLTGLTGEVDSVTLSNLSITGDRFSGTSVQTSKSGSSVNVVGSNATGAVNGIFSGAQTSGGIPDEVGGLFSLTGTDATLVGGFVAD